MSASLVGSEMCIRDRHLLGRLDRRNRADDLDPRPVLAGLPRAQASACAVSYTHLTLPTICSV
eukprot:5414978-Alexandrium_andersonii.AAC.1